MNRLALVLILAFILSGCAAKPPKEAEAPPEETPAEGEGKIMSFSLAGYEKSGKKKWEIEGRSADIMTEVVNLTDVMAKAYGEGGEVTLLADKGVFNRAVNDVHLESNVRVTSTGGTKMTTDALDWRNTEEKLETDRFVTITREDMLLTSVGAEAKQNMERIYLIKDVKVTSGKPQTVITCEGPMEINYKENFAIFNNKVKVEDERGQLYCDKATAYYDPDTRKVTKIVANGHVKIVRGGSWTFSDEAIYLAQEEKIILTGSPKVVIIPEETPSAPEGL